MKCKLAVVDARSDEGIVERLHDFAEEVFLFRSEGITYESISCHPDIFIYQNHDDVVLASNTPQPLLDKLQTLNIPYRLGNSSIGEVLRNSCYYNCVATDHAFFHREGFSDEVVLTLNKPKRVVSLPQSYTRCSMLALNNESFITSDAGIAKVLRREGYEVFFFDPRDIHIPVHAYGFLGGTCGKLGNQLLFMGNPLRHKDGAALCRFVEAHGVEVVALSDGYLYDGGGLFFFE